MIGRLMKASLVTRHKDPDDARVYRVSITEEGRRQVEKAMVGFAQIEEESFLGFTEDEKETFDRLASKMRNNLVHATQEEDQPCRWY
jgi:DNA-binding MarR family transcriptional regulator